MFAPRKAEGHTNGVSTMEAERAFPAPAYTAPSQSISVSTRSREANYSIINEWLKMKGDLESEGDILVKGKVLGKTVTDVMIYDNSTKFFAPLWLGNTGCEAIKVSAKITGKNYKAAPVTKTIPFACGE